MAPVLSKEAIQADIKAAMKGGDARRVSTLRLLLSSIRYREIELGKPLDAAEMTGVVSSSIKKRRESIEGYEKGNRQDLVQAEKEEMAILQEFLPPPYSEAELAALVEEAVRETGASGPKDMGTVMKNVMPKVAGRADGGLINRLVKAKLS